MMTHRTLCTSLSLLNLLRTSFSCLSFLSLGDTASPCRLSPLVRSGRCVVLPGCVGWRARRSR